jgi:ubiquinone/menaquinone biosynthesis C-methylase UbiE
MVLGHVRSVDFRTDRRSSENPTVARYADPAEVSSYVASYQGWGPLARYFSSRLYLIEQVLQGCAGELLDVGCGPGMMVSRLLDTRAGDFRITACDRSPAMIDAVRRRVPAVGDTRLTVASIEDMPFEPDEFDVVLAMGVLEYVDARRAVREIARVVRDDGLVVVTMLNPLSPYRLFDWFVHLPAVRLAGQVERLLGRRNWRRHAEARSGVRALRVSQLRRILRSEGLRPERLAYYDVTPLLPPFDRLIRRWARRWRDHPETTVGTGIRGRLGTGYLVTARRVD